MNQKNPHFLFPQTYFGSLEEFEQSLCDELEEMDQIDPWILVLEPDSMHPFQQKIGLFLHWTDY